MLIFQFTEDNTLPKQNDLFEFLGKPFFKKSFLKNECIFPARAKICNVVMRLEDGTILIGEHKDNMHLKSDVLFTVEILETV